MNDRLRKDMESKGIDVGLSQEILDAYNAGTLDQAGPVLASGLPEIDGAEVVDLRASGAESRPLYVCEASRARERLSTLGIARPEDFGTRVGTGDELGFSARELGAIGLRLLGETAYGVLNGGSATSYADGKKNLGLGKEVFDVLRPAFEGLAPFCKDKPKGLTPAYLNPDGSPGASFLELKMRARLILARSLAAGAGHKSVSEADFLPLYQMTSAATDGPLAHHYREVAGGPFLAPLSSSQGLGAASWSGGIQPLISAFSHSSEGRPKRFFDRAYGRQDSSLALPGGHGQCFRVLAPVLSSLWKSGKHFAYLGNVDNLGFTPEPVELAIFALSGKPAAFEFSARTAVDVKGGILVTTTAGKRTVADIGPAISFDELRRLEGQGKTILFNCATGLFDLDYLVPRLPELWAALPVRFSDQDKDAGRYSQAEQVTWEITGVLPSFLAFVVEKRRRFLAAKLLVETLLTSGVGLAEGRLPPEMATLAAGLNGGLSELLRSVYGLELEGGRWVPKD